ncbi:sigma-70 family RNA polymerase sigma factor [Mucilaginibacter sp.]|uniref:RNA polymerase sigma factor n=1 Tax=Mucilaginibacter sp. TaxID=1882438 RepID=UPI0025DC074E|nr:sigma-70 family RNA polymerase sigma factor [Mucilaginibacter sp.]
MEMEDYVKNINEGDQVAFEIVFNLSHKKVYAYFKKKTASTELADELTQLAFIKLWRFRHTLALQHSLHTQLFRIAKTTLLDHFKKVAIEERNLRSFYQETVSNEVALSSAYETNQQLVTILDHLPPIRKKVFVLSRIEGYTYSEIGEQLSISPRTVEKHISLALKQLGGYSGAAIIICLVHQLS